MAYDVWWLQFGYEVRNFIFSTKDKISYDKLTCIYYKIRNIAKCLLAVVFYFFTPIISIKGNSIIAIPISNNILV